MDKIGGKVTIMKKHLKPLLKLAVIYVLRFVMRVLSIFPIRKNRIVINSYRGEQYSCNPKYISQGLQKMYPEKYEIIWAFKNPGKYYDLKKSGIKLVSFASIKRFYYEATAKISINNIGSYSWMPVRKGQEHINTWHGAVDYKKVALSEINNDAVMKKTLLMSARETTLYLSANKFFSEYCIPTEFGYRGEILEYGLPRNDALYFRNTQKARDRIVRKYKINPDNIIVLYAPTWRYDPDQKITPLDFSMVKNSAEKRFGKSCTVIFRAHHITGCIGTGNDWVVDVTDYPDSQEIMASSDLLITDYSSMMWDFSLTGRPCFLYVPDIDTYVAERGFNISADKWGFSICTTSQELGRAIEGYNAEYYQKIVEKHHNMLGSYETGHATEKICQWIDGRCYGNKY